MTIRIKDDFGQIIYDHMMDNPYRVFCHSCGKELEVAEKTIDGDYDLEIQVVPCGCKHDTTI